MNTNNLSIAIVGATGLVGRTMLTVLEERNFPVGRLKLLASSGSAGMKAEFRGKEYIIEELRGDSFADVDIALFSAGKTVSLKYAPIAEKAGCIVIDNSSAWRTDPTKPLIVPEVNAELIKDYKGIIANPNCSTIQMLVALKPIHDAFGLKRVVVSTYQSITGAGQKGIDKLNRELEQGIGGVAPEELPIAFNTLFHDISDPSGFSEEEIKMQNETQKILNLPNLPVAVTCVRLPIVGGHGESLNIETEKPITPEAVRKLFSGREDIIVVDDPMNQKYPTVVACAGLDPVYIGRIRQDNTVENGLYLWICADNVRKGAATNAVQIAESCLNL